MWTLIIHAIDFVNSAQKYSTEHNQHINSAEASVDGPSLKEGAASLFQDPSLIFFL